MDTNTWLKFEVNWRTSIPDPCWTWLEWPKSIYMFTDTLGCDDYFWYLRWMAESLDRKKYNTTILGSQFILYTYVYKARKSVMKWWHHGKRLSFLHFFQTVIEITSTMVTSYAYFTKFFLTNLYIWRNKNVSEESTATLTGLAAADATVENSLCFL